MERKITIPASSAKLFSLVRLSNQEATLELKSYG
jgi:hypothetical protein